GPRHDCAERVGDRRCRRPHGPRTDRPAHARQVLLRGHPAKAGDLARDHGGVVATKTKRRAPARKRAASSRRTPVRQHLAPWARDAAGIGLVAFGLIAALGVWFDAAGVVGHGINVALHAVVGAAAVTLPVVALYWGVLLVRDSIAEQRLRMFLGFSIAAIGALAILSL